MNNGPIAVFASYLPESIGTKEDEDFSNSMYWLLENRYGCVISGAEKVVEAATKGGVRMFQ